MASQGRVRADGGGWISDPCIPPGTTPEREMLLAVIGALTLPPPATARDEVTYLRLSRDRAGLVVDAVRAATAPGAGGLDILFAAARLCDQLADYPDDTYDHAATS